MKLKLFPYSKQQWNEIPQIMSLGYPGQAPGYGGAPPPAGFNTGMLIFMIMDLILHS